MASTARILHVTDNIRIRCQKVLQSLPENVSGVPYLALAFVRAVDGEMMVESRRESVHSFADCSLTNFKEYIEDEDLLASGLEPDEVDTWVDEICHAINMLVSRYAGVEGMERLQMDVVFEMHHEREYATVADLEAAMWARIWRVGSEEDEEMYPAAEEEKWEEDVENDCRRRMTFVHTFVYGGARGGSPAAGMGGGGACEEEVCAICLAAMKVGEEVICAPCIHRFHAACIRSWFKRSCFCPLCRFKIDDR